MMSAAAERLIQIRERIDRATSRAGRSADSVTLLAVSKTFPAEAVAELFAAGQTHFAESRQQEAETKMPALPAGIEWHFIGHLQRNKVRKVLAGFPTIHSVDSLRLAEHISQVAGEMRLSPQIFLQVNIAAEPSKHGFTPGELRTSIAALLRLPNLRVLGLMAIPPEEDHPDDARRWFAAVRQLRDELTTATGHPLPGLSMGMSGDFEAAIEEGSTIVRVGSALFGARAYPQ